MEQKIVGSWSWQYIEGRGRMVFSRDHTVKAGFPPEEELHRPLRDDDFTFIESGSWHLEGDVLVQELDNHLMVDTWTGDESERPKLEKRVLRERITKIDDSRIMFDDSSRLDREKP
jgi:hypothetical protein